jgi:hypothetical protein
MIALSLCRVVRPGQARDTPIQIIGVVEDMRLRMDSGRMGGGPPTAEIDKTVFEPLYQKLPPADVLDRPGRMDMGSGSSGGAAGLSFVFRAQRGPLAAADLRRVVHEVDPALAVEDLITMGQVFSGLTARPRFYAAVVTLFGAVDRSRAPPAGPRGQGRRNAARVQVLMAVPRSVAVIASAMFAACTTASHTIGGPVPQFNGEYRIVEARQGASILPDEFGALSRISDLTNRVQESTGDRLGTMQVRPAVGGEYAEWTIVLDEPAHEIRLLLGPKLADGTFPIWRFEQQPAPTLAHEGRARLEGNQMIADFVVVGPADPRRIVRERWTRSDDGRLEFDLEGGVDDGPFRRVGGFVAVRD